MGGSSFDEMDVTQGQGFHVLLYVLATLFVVLDSKTIAIGHKACPLKSHSAATATNIPESLVGQWHKSRQRKATDTLLGYRAIVVKSIIRQRCRVSIGLPQEA